jgi:hypothetical protein
LRSPKILPSVLRNKEHFYFKRFPNKQRRLSSTQSEQLKQEYNDANGGEHDKKEPLLLEKAFNFIEQGFHSNGLTPVYVQISGLL